MRRIVASAALLLVTISPSGYAQSVSYAAVHGVVRAPAGLDSDGARVMVSHGATGFVVEAEVRRGRFVVHGLEAGGPYTVTVRRLGFRPLSREGLMLAAGEERTLHFELQAIAVGLDTLRISAGDDEGGGALHGATVTTIDDSVLRRIPFLGGDVHEVVRLAPQVSARTGFRTGFSAAGVGLRFNNYQVNGASERNVGANATPAFSGGRSLPADAVKEYQVHVAPFDVRYGDFTGGLVNAITRTGTNRFEGSAFATARSDHLARRAGVPDYERLLVGASAGGPLVRDRLLYFGAIEWQHHESPASGPYIGAAGASPLPLIPSLARLDSIALGYGLTTGSAALVQNRNPQLNAFARIDLALPGWNSRAALWTNYHRFSNTAFARADTFSLSTYDVESVARPWQTAAQLLTTWRSGAHHDFLVSYRDVRFDPQSMVDQPVVNVAVPNSTGGVTTVRFGTPPVAQLRATTSSILRGSSTLVLPIQATHALTLGVEAERIRATSGGALGNYGTWWFGSVDSLAAGLPNRFEITRDFGSRSIPLDAVQLGAFASEQWRIHQRLVVTLGLRADQLRVAGHAPYNATVDSIFGRRTDVMPDRRIAWSPRFGFTWEVPGATRDRVRGGVGIFSGRPPLSWYQGALTSFGEGTGTLRCGSAPRDNGSPPAFEPDHRSAPTTCASGVPLAENRQGDVNLLDRRLHLGRTLRASLAWERLLPGGLRATAEAMLTRQPEDFRFVNLNLEGPAGIDRYGRVLYGVISPNGVAVPRVRSGFSEVIDLVNTSRNRSHQFSLRVEKRYTDGAWASASYTFSRVRDVQSPVRTGTPGRFNWAPHAVSGYHDDPHARVSVNDIPHRVIVAGLWRTRARWPTEFSLYYVGESGTPFTWVTGGEARRGDLNADGSNANDPVYVPRNARDTSEIRFTGLSADPDADNSPAAQLARVAAQQDAFERFITGMRCLQDQRGRIMARNSCREPWVHTTAAAVRQALGDGKRGLHVELQVFNLLNLLHRRWGEYRIANGRTDVAAPALLEHVGQDGTASAHPVFRFRTTAPSPWRAEPLESAYQLQFVVRYRF
jgi:hypothetical protein